MDKFWRDDEKPETKVFWSLCLEDGCEWESESYDNETDCPNECGECGSDDVRVENDWI